MYAFTSGCQRIGNPSPVPKFLKESLSSSVAVIQNQNPPVARAYAFSMQKWVQLILPPSVQYLKPVSASNGLVLFSGIPSEGMIPIFRQWWPLVVVNPITRKHRSLLLMVEPLPEMEEGYPDCYSQVHMGLKVNADSNTYKVVVVHWKASRRVVQIFDSGRGDSSTAAPLDCCRPAANNNIPLPERTVWGFPTVGESCLYIVSYDCVLPFTFSHILKRERSSQTWQLVAKVPLDVVSSYPSLDPDAHEYLLDSAGTACRVLLSVLECGKHLLSSGGHHFNWYGMLYDLDKQRWNAPDAVNLHSASECDGLFFQPQLNGPPC